MALIECDRAGPVDPLVELAQACRLNAKLHDDQVAEREGLAPVAERARQIRAIVDGCRLAGSQRRSLVDTIIEFTVIATATDEAELAGITSESTVRDLDERVPWALTWRAGAAAWQLRDWKVLEQALA